MAKNTNLDILDVLSSTFGKGYTKGNKHNSQSRKIWLLLQRNIAQISITAQPTTFGIDLFTSCSTYTQQHPTRDGVNSKVIFMYMYTQMLPCYITAVFRNL